MRVPFRGRATSTARSQEQSRETARRADQIAHAHVAQPRGDTHASSDTPWDKRAYKESVHSTPLPLDDKRERGVGGGASPSTGKASFNEIQRARRAPRAQATARNAEEPRQRQGQSTGRRPSRTQVALGIGFAGRTAQWVSTVAFRDPHLGKEIADGADYVRDALLARLDIPIRIGAKHAYADIKGAVRRLRTEDAGPAHDHEARRQNDIPSGRDRSPSGGQVRGARESHGQTQGQGQGGGKGQGHRRRMGHRRGSHRSHKRGQPAPRVPVAGESPDRGNASFKEAGKARSPRRGGAKTLGSGGGDADRDVVRERVALGVNVAGRGAGWVATSFFRRPELGKGIADTADYARDAILVKGDGPIISRAKKSYVDLKDSIHRWRGEGRDMGAKSQRSADVASARERLLTARQGGRVSQDKSAGQDHGRSQGQADSQGRRRVRIVRRDRGQGDDGGHRRGGRERGAGGSAGPHKDNSGPVQKRIHGKARQMPSSAPRRSRGPSL